MTFTFAPLVESLFLHWAFTQYVIYMYVDDEHIAYGSSTQTVYGMARRRSWSGRGASQGSSDETPRGQGAIAEC
ncbi:hypothetical protein Taro_031071 [Colocasia esculenta]|uniref:Uncharacterized protein n=1 Tax=Colocasia esculenta TaxID=4460 RepID=A0A843VN00_COLES|nr:hypothetical protein [Colocasia esculenta]